MRPALRIFFFFNDTATTEIYTLSLHDALPISACASTRTCSSSNSTSICSLRSSPSARVGATHMAIASPTKRSEEHTSELQSHSDLVCRLLLEKKKRPGPRHRQHDLPNALANIP